jgi:hypothetical protein
LLKYRPHCAVSHVSIEQHKEELSRRESLAVNPTYHSPLYEGDFIGFLKPATLFDRYSSIGYAEGERKLLWGLPGHGSPYVDCGVTNAKGCDNTTHVSHGGKTFVRLWRRSCKRKSCPVCYEGWASAQAERALIRYASFKFKYSVVDRFLSSTRYEHRKSPPLVFHTALVDGLEDMAQSGKFKPIHVVLSPPPSLCKDTVKSYTNVKRTAYRLAREHGLFAGSMIFHPYRLKCSRCSSVIPDHDKSCPACGGDCFLWYWSPHFHAVGFGWIHHTSEGYEKHGWVIKNLGVRDSIFATFQYLLSHAGVSSCYTTTWFGRISYNKMGVVPKVGSVFEVCPHCERALKPLVWNHVDRPPPTELSNDPYLNEWLADSLDWKGL